MRRAAVIAVALAAAALTFAGCGGQKRTIPTKTAESFLNQLDTIGSQFDAQACQGAHAKVVALRAQARQLPSSVDSTVRRNLVEGIQRLDQLVTSDCQKPPTPTNTNTTPTVPTVPTTPPPTSTIPTTPTTTPTTPTTPPPSNTVPSTTTPPPPTTPGGGGGGVTVPGGTTGAGGASLGRGSGNGQGSGGPVSGDGTGTQGSGG